MDYTKKIKEIKHEIFELEFKIRLNGDLSGEDNEKLINLKKELRILLTKKATDDQLNKKPEKKDVADISFEEKFRQYYEQYFTYRGKKMNWSETVNLATYRLNQIKNKNDARSIEEMKILHKIIKDFEYKKATSIEERNKLISYYTNGNKGR